MIHQPNLFLDDDDLADDESESGSSKETSDQYNAKLARSIHAGHAEWNHYQTLHGLRTRPCPCDNCLKHQTKRLYVVPNHWNSDYFHLEWLYDGHANTERDMIMGGKTFKPGPPGRASREPLKERTHEQSATDTISSNRVHRRRH